MCCPRPLLCLAPKLAVFPLRYAKHLSDSDRLALSLESDGFSGRDIKRIAETVERSHVSAQLRRPGFKPSELTPPPLQLYKDEVLARRSHATQAGPGSRSSGKATPLIQEMCQ